MKNTYGGWNKDFNGDMSAASYFDSLPLEVKEEINKNADKIKSIDDMRRYADQMRSTLD